MRKIVVSLAVAAGLASSPALAAGATGQQTTGTVQVSLNVSTACSVTAEPLSFGSVTSLAGQSASSPTTVQCTPGAAYIVTVDLGKNAGATAQRKLKSTTGTATVDYGIYSDSGNSTAWPTAGVTGTGTGASQAMTLFGKITQTTAVGAGDYADQLTVTLDY